MNNRIRTILEEYNLSASKFADIVDVQASGISHILSGRNKPGYDFIRKVLIAFPEVSSDWLILGKGNMKREIPTDTNSLPVDKPSSCISEIKEDANLFNSQSTNNLTEVAVDQSKLLPSASTRETDTQQQGVSRLFSESAGKLMEKVIIFYSDKTFSVYSPE